MNDRDNERIDLLDLPFDLEAALEALLFVSDEPVTALTLADIIGIAPSRVEEALRSLSDSLHERGAGIQLREVAGGWRLYSHPAFHALIKKYVLSWDTHKLSQAALEALAVVAYHQPVARSGISAIRGVNSDGVVSSLTEKGLIRPSGRERRPGGAVLYVTTNAFLERFGLNSLDDLPPIEDFAPDEESRRLIRERLGAGSLSGVNEGPKEIQEELGFDEGDEVTSEADGSGQASGPGVPDGGTEADA